MDPGYSGDSEVHTALSLVTRARSISVQEIFDYADYGDFEFTGKAMGFGLPADVDEKPMLFQPGDITSMWGGPVRNLANQLGIELDEVRERFEPWCTPQPIDCLMATLEPGQMTAVRFAVEGVRDGVPVITMGTSTGSPRRRHPIGSIRRVTTSVCIALSSKASLASRSTRTCLIRCLTRRMPDVSRRRLE